MTQIRIVSAAGVIPAASGSGYLLVNGTTYYATANLGERALQSFQLTADDAIALTSVTIEDTNTDAALTETAAYWTPTNAASVAVGVSAGAGLTVSGTAVIAKTAGVAGSVMINIPNNGAARTRLAIVVGATGGVLGVAPHGKFR